MLVYYSRTNNTKRMYKKLAMDIPFVNIADYDGTSKFVLVTPTYGIGEIPEEVDEFLKNHHKNMQAVIASGNMNWTPKFAYAGDLISKQYSVPLLCRYELSGLGDDIENLRKAIGKFYGIYQTE